MLPKRFRIMRGILNEDRMAKQFYSTVTDFARFRGWSTSQPRRTAM
jgi:hypothetical protein